jgi:hypothetical protein
MIHITKKMTLKELASLVGKILKDAAIDAVLTGGAVVSIYTDNKYQSFDLDFITYSSLKELEKVFKGTGFYRDGRFFKHPETDFFIDFPAPPISVGNTPVTEFNEIVSKNKYLKLLTPTHCVMDRLAANYHWDDQQALVQALMVAHENVIDFEKIKKWSTDEGMSDKFEYFFSEYKKSRSNK